MEMGHIVAIVITGLIIVFIGLALLIICVTLLGLINRKKKVAEPPVKAAPPQRAATPAAPAPKPKAVIESGVSDEVIAVISAAVAAMSTEEKTFAIRGIKRASTGRPVWALAGLHENTGSF